MNILKMLIVATVLLMATPAFAAELLMIHNPDCGFCRAFMEQVEPTYGETPEGKALPLRVLDVTRLGDVRWIRDNHKAGLIDPIEGTPTFIIWDGEEFDRIAGYGGKDWFYTNLRVILEDFLGE